MSGTTLLVGTEKTSRAPSGGGSLAYCDDHAGSSVGHGGHCRLVTPRFVAVTFTHPSASREQLGEIVRYGRWRPSHGSN
jgi:hypothetical protein